MAIEPFTIEINATFNTFKELKHTLKLYAIQNNFETRTIRCDKRRYQLKCKAEGCTWSLRARSIVNSNIWRIADLNSQHNCVGVLHTGNSTASAQFLATEIIEKVRAQPDIKPKNLKKDIQRQYGIEIPYSRVWSAKEFANAMINGSHEETYTKLPKYCEELLAANPESFIEYERTNTNQFRRLFLCFGASAKGYASCKPLLGIDGTSIKNKYQGILLTATATDAEGHLFPLAFGIADIEDKDNWLWFLGKLRGVLERYVPAQIYRQFGITILSDRQKGLIQGVSQHFPLAARGYCLKHLEKNLKNSFKHPELSSLLWKAAASKSVAEFDKHMDNFRKINQKAFEWLINETEPANWVDCFFAGRRYGHYTSNIAESINSWLLEAREQPLIPMLDTIRQQLMAWFDNRRREAAGLPDDGVVPTLSKAIRKLNDAAHRYTARHAVKLIYEVKSLQSNNEYVPALAFNSSPKDIRVSTLSMSSFADMRLMSIT